ncbi:MAG: DUF3310 domain-containing protein [Crocinitomicaceae bacterium]|nr:DUF3310 domain-containing protein [Crocinitomicaceae bacterium]
MSFKYDEKKNLDDVIEYIKNTYNQHYVGDDDNGTQIQDLLNSIGVAEHFCQGNAMKYVARYGRKKGKNKLDLYKAIHYILLLMYFSETSEENHEN